MKQARGESHRVRSKLRRGIVDSEVALVAYLAATVTLTLLHGRLGAPGIDSLASSPHSVAVGRWWLLVTSGLLVAKTVLPQVALVLLLGVALLHLCGTRVFWLTVIVGHVLSTALVYLGVWTIGAFDPVSVAVVSRRLDYGLSLVWCAGFGALALATWMRVPKRRRMLRLLLPAISLALLIIIAIFSDPLGRYEHVLAFLNGGGVVFVAARSSWRPEYSGDSNS